MQKSVPNSGAKIGMARTLTALTCAALWAAALALAASAMPMRKPLKRVSTIELPGPAGKPFGSMAIDAERHLLFVAHAGAGQLYVINLTTEQVIKTVDDLPGAQDIALVRDEGDGKIYVTDPGDDSVAVLDARSLEVTTRIPTQSRPGGLAYAEDFDRLYVSDAGARAEAMVDTRQDAAMGIAPMGSPPAELAYDAAAKKVYVNLPEENLVAVLDPASGRLSGRNPMGRCEGNRGIALDAEKRRGFLSCAGNDLLTVLDLEKMTPIEFLHVKPGADAVAVDARLRRIYVACASGWISTVEEFEDKGAVRYRKLRDTEAANAVGGLAVDPASHRVYTAEQEEDGAPVARLAVYEPQP
jgi:YVTN family beta-propeller protein